ncbi:MAG TPA: bifunctional 4-hydroxy-2-oxoglutarate aldolase/2-dehydro-3-deoxy-phosphogluconate aldolase [Candidatus Eremiobacteraceae bacterium]|jgi:2-dehydro-3-deoxyphosphogluconate aldolase/(4S)-4-hydroxy-2-oxoglutarate aldolase|nr:bifunctional 4-hydroxy-2-oxoglutarate aldolase/2-dehydro-3-deoxy-phosphogluconate aldolase [Candidatus Eremiobacteraceae bacterium]
MNKAEVCALISEIAIIPAIRVSSSEEAHFAAEAVTRGGIPIVEITMTVPGAVDLISHLVHFHPKMMVGAGTVLDLQTARQCVDAGAHFLTAPGFDPAIVEFAVKQNIAVLPGALTPTEVIAAWRAGGDFVKVFPCAQVGGDKYIKALKLSLPQIPLIAAGGVNQQTALDFMLAGAAAIGVGTDLIPIEALERRQGDRIRELAFRFAGYVKEARARMQPAKRTASKGQNFTGTENCDVP